MEKREFKLFSLKRLSAAASLALVICIVFPFFSFFADCSDIRNSVVRLHILANSDSPQDQTVKLIVRNAVLSAGAELFCGEADTANARRIFEKEKEKIEETADAVLRENGFDYSCSAECVREYFDTREYDGFTLPAGKYLAVRLILGRGKGHNWWCVMFPPLCIPAAQSEQTLSDCFGKNTAEVTSPSKYRIRFKTVEIIEKIISRFDK